MPLLFIHECLNIFMNMLFTVIKSESAIKLIEQCNQEFHNSNLSLLSIPEFQIQDSWPFESSATLLMLHKDSLLQMIIKFKLVCLCVFVFIMLQRGG